MLRLRQICLVASELAPAEEDLIGVFGLATCYRDPAVEKYGLVNALLPVGNGFLEVVAPFRDGTAAARYLERRGGDGGYIVILQCDEIDARRARYEALGVRIIASLTRDDSDGVQLHPRDTGGAMLQTSWNAGDEVPDGPWHPAGDDWKPYVRTGRVTAMTAAELQSDDPATLAARWGEILGDSPVKDANGTAILRLDDAILRFVLATDGRGEGLGGVDLAVADRDAVLAAAAARNRPVSGDVVTVCGTRFRLVP